MNYRRNGLRKQVTEVKGKPWSLGGSRVKVMPWGEERGMGRAVGVLHSGHL